MNEIYIVASIVVITALFLIVRYLYPSLKTIFSKTSEIKTFCGSCKGCSGNSCKK